MPLAFGQGDLDPKNAPGPTMKSLQEIWDRIGVLEAQLGSQAAVIASQQEGLRSLRLIAGRLLEDTDVSWQLKVILPSTPQPMGSSLAFDPAGRPSIAYNNGFLSYCRFNGSFWEHETIDPDAFGTQLSHVFGPDGTACVAYRSSSSGNLVFAKRGPAGWQRTNIAPSYQGASLAFGPDGHPAIAFTNPSYQVSLAKFGGSAWTVTIAENAGTLANDVSFRFGPDGHPAIAYFDNNNWDLRFVRFNGTSWSSSTVASAGVVGQYPSLAFGPNNQPAIAYIDQTNQHARLASFDGTSWQQQTVSTQGRSYTSLAFGPDGEPAVTYYSNRLMLARRKGSWTAEIVDAAEAAGYQSSLKFSPDGQPAISYNDGQSAGGALKYASKGVFIPAP